MYSLFNHLTPRPSLLQVRPVVEDHGARPDLGLRDGHGEVLLAPGLGQPRRRRALHAGHPRPQPRRRLPGHSRAEAARGGRARYPRPSFASKRPGTGVDGFGTPGSAPLQSGRGSALAAARCGRVRRPSARSRLKVANDLPWRRLGAGGFGNPASASPQSGQRSALAAARRGQARRPRLFQGPWSSCAVRPPPALHACAFVERACSHEGAVAYRDIAAQAARGRWFPLDPGYGGYVGPLVARPLLLSWWLDIWCFFASC